MLTRKAINAAIFCIPILWGVMSTVTPAQASTQYPLVDSGVWTDLNSFHGWLDNHEIVFRGAGTGVLEKGESTMTISTWRIGESVKVQKTSISQMCFSNGNLYYVQVDQISKKKNQFFGRYGSEKPLMDRTLYLPTCQVFPEGQDKSRQLLPLLPEHGYLDRGSLVGMSRIENTPVQYFKKGSDRAITLPFGRRDMEGGVKYSSFKNSYLFTSQFFNKETKVTSSPWPKDLPRILWWMGSDGTVTSTTVQAPWNTSTEFFPTAAGLAISGYDERVRRPSEKDIGLFLLQPGGGVQKIASGYARNVAVSPDGCQVAFAHSEKVPLVRPDVKLKVARLCK
ncbi:MAG: hypothetical protein ACT6Q9_07955 [Polaromonas sp.]|uniref:hypothetical protein n=1 Tax=Polaromonas sp. TaxID=1869339 RepID=UPI0040361707